MKIAKSLTFLSFIFPLSFFFFFFSFFFFLQVQNDVEIKYDFNLFRNSKWQDGILIKITRIASLVKNRRKEIHPLKSLCRGLTWQT